MAEFDLVVRGGTVITGTDTVRADVGIRGGRIVAIADSLSGPEVLDAGGLLVLPGGIDTHCHIEQLRADGTADEETWESGSASCLVGGTTSVVTFSTQFKGAGILEPLAEYRRRAKQAMVDYSFHQIITDATDEVIWQEIPRVVAEGIRSLKVFLTYDPLHLDDRAYLRVLAAARRNKAFVTVHCENYEAIGWRTEALLAAGCTAPKYHAWSRPSIIEREATHRAIALAEMVDQPIQVFHVSCAEVAEEVARAQVRGLKVWAETCTQYFVLTAQDQDRPGFEGAKFMCSPSPRDAAEHARMWDMVRRGVLDVVSSDHSGWCYEGPRGKRMNGDRRVVPRHSQRRARLVRPPADPVQRGRRQGKHRSQPLCPPDRDQSSEAVRADRQGQHRNWLRRRSRAVGPGEAGDDRQRADAASHRLHAV